MHTPLPRCFVCQETVDPPYLMDCSFFYPCRCQYIWVHVGCFARYQRRFSHCPWCRTSEDLAEPHAARNDADDGRTLLTPATPLLPPTAPRRCSWLSWLSGLLVYLCLLAVLLVVLYPYRAR